MKSAQGFTLIEILLVIGIIGILASIAIPAYNNYVIRGKLVDASTQLASARVNMEQFFQDYRAYDNSNGGTSPCTTLAATKYFSFTCNPLTPTSYTVIASSNANQGLGNAGSYQYTIDNNNNKTTQFFAGQTLGAQCWIMKQGDSC
jgi:type IV pilus assembly protein PilE